MLLRMHKSEELARVATDPIFNEYSGRTILIAGATGFISRFLVMSIILYNETADNKIQLILLCRDEKKARLLYGNWLNSPYIKIIEQDIKEPITIKDKVDYIIHAAADSNPSRIKDNPASLIEANILGVKTIFDFARLGDVQSVLYLSSYMVYGNLDGKIKEGMYQGIDILNESNSYTIAKRCAENLCVCYNKEYGIPSKIIRPAFVYGPSDDTDIRVYAEIIKSVSLNKDILLTSDGGCTRPVIFVYDLVRAILHILKDGKICFGYDVYSRYISIRKFAEIALNCSDKKIFIKYKNYEDSLKIIPDIMEENSINQCKKDTNWTEWWDIKSSLKESIEYLQNKYKVTVK